MSASQRTILITGATSGIGYQAAIRMISLNHKLIIPCRNISRKKETLHNLKKDIADFQNLVENISLPIVDLSDLSNIECFVKDLYKKLKCIDSLILNAGLQYTGSSEIRWSKQNIELTFSVNHLSHHYLANKLLDLLFLSDSPKIIITSSEVHNPELPGGRVGLPASLGDLEGLASGAGFKMIDGDPSFNADKAYKDSKLCNILFSKELARRIFLLKKKCPVISWAPGLVIPRSIKGFFRHSRKNNEFGQRLFALIARDILMISESPANAGQLLMKIENSIEYLDEKFIYLNNKLIGLRQHRLISDSTSIESNDLTKAKELWELSNKLIKECTSNDLNC